MIKKTLNLKNVKTLSKAEKRQISGGNWGGGFGCQPQLIECDSDNDCPCNRQCGLTFEVNGQIFLANVCNF